MIWVLLAIGAFGIATIGLLTLVEERPEESRSASYSQLHADLLSKIGSSASIKGRLVGSSDLQATLEGSRGPKAPPLSVFAFARSHGPMTRELLQLEAELEKRLGDRAAPEDLATAGALHLLQGRVELAVDELQRAANASPSDGRILNDLSLSYLELARLRDAPHLLVSGLEAALLALEAEPSPPEARFNAAIALEELGLWSRARSSWMKYLDEDASSVWARQAQRRLANLEALVENDPSGPLDVTPSGELPYEDHELTLRVSAAPHEARKLVETNLLASWAEAAHRGDVERAHRFLASARRVSSVVHRLTDDPMAEDAVELIDKAVRAGDRRQLVLLIEAHRAYSRGLETSLHDGCGDSDASLHQALELFHRAGSPFEGWASIELAICHYYGQTYEESRYYLDRASRIATKGPYPALAGRTLWISGLVAMVEGDLPRSLAFYQEALLRFDELGESEHVAYLHSLIAKDLRILGASEEAWTHRIRALRRHHRIPGADRSFTVLQEAAKAVEAEGPHLLAAGAILDELVARTEAVRSADARDLLAFALLARAEVAVTLGQLEAAERDVHRVSELMAAMPLTFRLRSRLSSAFELAMGRIEAERDADAALTRFNIAMEYYRGAGVQGGERIELVRAATLRASLLRKLGRLAEAEADLATGIFEAEQQGERLEDPQLEIEFRERMEELYREMVALQLELNRPERALEYLERARLRSFRALVGTMTADEELSYVNPWREPSVGPIVASLPENVHGLIYAPLDEHLAIWVLSANGVHVRTVEIGREELRRRVTALRDTIERRGPIEEVRPLASQLFESMIPEEVRALSSSATLLIVPGPELWSLPFSALFDSNRGQYLIETHNLTFLPAASFLEHLGSRAPRWSSPRTAAIVADPAFNRSRFPRLARLPGASRSANAVQRVFTDARVVFAQEATRSAVLRTITGAEVVHFAGHAVAGPGGPGSGGLLLAPDGASDEGNSLDILAARDLIDHVDGVRLMVLESCRSALSSWAASDEVGGLAGSMVAAGIPAVIATLWDIEDTTSQEFSEQLYSSVAEGLPPPEALRSTLDQLATDRRGLSTHPADWAGYVLVGYPYVDSSHRTYRRFSWIH